MTGCLKYFIRQEKDMKKNVGGIDRILRIIVGVSLIAAGIYSQTWWGLIGFIPLLTGIFQICPAYGPLKINTYKE